MIILMMTIAGCAVNSTEKAAELYADEFSKGLREANMVWSEYPPESYYD